MKKSNKDIKPLNRVSNTMNTLDNVSQHNVSQIGIVSKFSERQISGPIPAPDVFNEYSEDAKNWILKNADFTEQNRMERLLREQEYRTDFLKREQKNQIVAYIIGAFIFLLIIIAVVFCAYIGKENVACILASSCLVSAIPAVYNFLKSNNEQETDNKNK